MTVLELRNLLIECVCDGNGSKLVYFHVPLGVHSSADEVNNAEIAVLDTGEKILLLTK